MHLFLALMVPLAAGRLVEMLVYQNTGCEDTGNVVCRGLLGPESGGYSGTVYSWWYALNWTAVLKTESDVLGGFYSLRLNKDNTSAYMLGRFGQCEFLHPRTWPQGEATYRLRLLDEPWFNQPSCATDADCEDGIDCTTNRCNRATGFCDTLPDDMQCGQRLYNTCIPKTCFGGPFHRRDCSIDGDCPAGLCSASICTGGLYDGAPCAASYIRDSSLIVEMSTYSCVRTGEGLCHPGGSGGCFFVRKR